MPKSAHGTRARYQSGCRCAPCTQAQNRYTRDYKRIARATRTRIHGPKRVPSAPSMWRIRSLSWAGWTQTELAARLGESHSQLGDLVAGKYATVSAVRALAIEELFEELCLVDGGNEHARTVAERNGWPPPLSLTEDGRPTDPCQRGHYQGSTGECRECRRWRERENARKQREGGASPL